MSGLYGRKGRWVTQMLGRRLLTQELGVSQSKIQKALNQLERERHSSRMESSKDLNIHDYASGRLDAVRVGGDIW